MHLPVLMNLRKWVSVLDVYPFLGKALCIGGLIYHQRAITNKSVYQD